MLFICISNSLELEHWSYLHVDTTSKALDIIHFVSVNKSTEKRTNLKSAVYFILRMFIAASMFGVVVVLLPLRRRRARLLKRCRRWTPRETRRAECRSFGWSYWQKVVVRSLLMFSDRYVWIMNIVINSIYTL